MSWAHGYRDGRDIGYLVEATCDEPGCDAKIDRGLAFCCGEAAFLLDGTGCGKFYCHDHLIGIPMLCVRCNVTRRVNTNADMSYVIKTLRTQAAVIRGVIRDDAHLLRGLIKSADASAINLRRIEIAKIRHDWGRLDALRRAILLLPEETDEEAEAD